MRILQVSTYDIGGGAEKVAWNLHRAYRALGHSAWLAVGHRATDDPFVLRLHELDRHPGWRGLWLAVGDLSYSLVGRIRGAGRLRDLAPLIGQPRSLLETWRGHENFEFPSTRRLLELTPEIPDVVHCHNLHGGYFDLRVLPWLSYQVPLAMTLHDAWFLTGHCTHSFGCERWKDGCGDCPDLSIHYAVRRDATAYNWQRKRDIYRASRLYVSTPTQRMMNQVRNSILAPAVADARVIPNGVDLDLFHPADMQAVRSTLAIPSDVKVLLFAANGIRRNIYKDFETLRAAIAEVGERLRGQNVLFIALGEDAPAERIGSAEIRFVPYQKDPAIVARYYQAADIYLHAAKVEADTFPTVVLEALACGKPVVATSVGGIPEQVEDGVTGFLTPPSDPEKMATAITRLLRDDALRNKMAGNAAEDARRRFDLNRQVNTYLTWYQEVINNHRRMRNDGHNH